MADKTIIFIEANFDSVYGAQRSMLTLMRGLQESGYEAKAVLTGRGALNRLISNNGMPVAVIAASSRVNAFGKKISRYSFFTRINFLLDLLLLNIRMTRHFARHRPDAICCNSARAVTYVALAAVLLRIPLLFYVRSDFDTGIAHRLAIRVATKVLLIARGVAKAFPPADQRRYKNKIQVLYTGFKFPLIDDLEARRQNAKREVISQLGLPEQDSLVVLVGSISPRKGQEVAIDAMAHLGRRDIQLLLVGSGPEDTVKALESHAIALGVEDNVHFVGYTDKTADYFLASDVSLLPSSSEGLPRSAIESLAYGTPVIGTPVGGMDEVISTETLGTIVPRDAALLARAIHDWVYNRKRSSENEVMLHMMRRTYVINKFPIDHYIYYFQQLVEEL